MKEENEQNLDSLIPCKICKEKPIKVRSPFGYHVECACGIIIPAFGARSYEVAAKNWNESQAESQ